MGELQRMAQDYLQAAGYSLLDVREGSVIADRLGFGGDRDTRLLWVLKEDVTAQSLPNELRRLLEEFRAATTQYPDARYYFLAEKSEGITAEFRAETTRLRVKFAVPANFFDAPFRVEDAPEHISAIRAIRERGATQKRIAQPFSLMMEREFVPAKGDLFAHLYDEIKDPKRSQLHIVVGAAGMGKSVLYDSLFSRYYELFLSEKRSQRTCRRPIPFVPEYLRGAASLRTEELIRNFLRSDVAVPLTLETFEWLAVNGFSIWMFDGLDELYQADAGFFENLLELLTRAKSRAQFLVCARDSLLTSSDEFVRLIEDWGVGPDHPICLHKLEDWDRPAKRAFSWVYLEGRIPDEGERDTPSVSRFLHMVTASPGLAALSSLPYYCALLAEGFREGNTCDVSDDQALIEFAVSNVIDREEKKGLLRPDEFVKGGVREWLEAVAFEFYSQNYKGLAKSDVEDYAQLVLKPSLPSNRITDAVMTLIQFPLFTTGAVPGVVRFKHELVAEYLAGCYLLGRVAPDPEWVASRLVPRTDLGDSLILRYLAKNLGGIAGRIEAVATALRQGNLRDRPFCNLLNLLLLATPEPDIIQRSGIVLEGRTLSSVRFVRRNLRELSFRNTHLSNTVFRRCELAGAFFEGAILSGTRFEEIPPNGLNNAHFGAFDRFESVYVDKRRIEERSAMAGWLREVTSLEEGASEPCPAALQLRALFLKYLRPDGAPRRDTLSELALTKGKRFPGAPSHEECLKACSRFGLLEPPDFRDQIARTRGDGYGDMRSFVTHWQMSTALRELLNTLCRTKGCRHVP